MKINVQFKSEKSTGIVKRIDGVLFDNLGSRLYRRYIVRFL